MISRYSYKKITWIDLESPTQEEVRQIMEEFDVHPLVANELLSPTLRPKVDFYGNLIYLILHFPTFSHRHGGSEDQEIDFIIGKDFIITTHYELIDPLHEFSRVFEVNSIIDKSLMGTHAGYVFYYILKNMYRSLDHELEEIETSLKKIEREIFEGHERDMVEVISHVNRTLLDFKQSIRLHSEVLASLETVGADFFGKNFAHYLKVLTGEYYRVAGHLEGHREMLGELRDTNNSLLTTKQNETMKAFTITAFTTLPMTLIAAVFGMNAEDIPIVGSQGDFWIILILMLLASFSLFFYFRTKNIL